MTTKAQENYDKRVIKQLLHQREQREFIALFYVKCPYCGAIYAVNERTNRNGFDVCPECWNKPQRRSFNMQKLVNVPKIENLDYKQKYYRCLIAINEFNSLPWWRRLFFKFDIAKFRGLFPAEDD